MTVDGKIDSRIGLSLTFRTFPRGEFQPLFNIFPTILCPGVSKQQPPLVTHLQRSRQSAGSVTCASSVVTHVRGTVMEQ